MQAAVEPCAGQPADEGRGRQQDRNLHQLLSLHPGIDGRGRFACRPGLRNGAVEGHLPWLYTTGALQAEKAGGSLLRNFAAERGSLHAGPALLAAHLRRIEIPVHYFRHAPRPGRECSERCCARLKVRLAKNRFHRCWALMAAMRDKRPRTRNGLIYLLVVQLAAFQAFTRYWPLSSFNCARLKS